jgi:hypothetical protein
VTGRFYRLAGERVAVLAAFTLPSKRNPLPDRPPWLIWHRPPKGAPRNVLIEHVDGQREVRPFRGLRCHAVLQEVC